VQKYFQGYTEHHNEKVVLAAKEVIDYISKIQSKIEGLGIKTE
jgi:hypothetical protein